jgi:hypothetical protein
MILTIVMLAVLCLVLIFKMILPDFLDWEDRVIIAFMLLAGVAAGGLSVAAVWVGFCAAIHWTIQNILT